MEIRPLDRQTYTGRKFTACYRTNGYYDLHPSEDGFRMNYVALGAAMEKSFDDAFFGGWLESPTAFGAFEGEALIGFAEGSMESWNNRFRISNLCVFDPAMRGGGVGRRLMDAIHETARAAKARMIVLETQSCNERAIAFYKRNGFEIIGFDLYTYSNADPERREVRIEMGKKLAQDSI